MKQNPNRDVESLLVFYANGTLEGEERAFVEEALEQDAQLREDLRYLLDLRAEMQAEETGPHDEVSFRKLMRDIETTTQDVLERTRYGNGSTLSVSRWVAGLAVIALVLQSVVLWSGSGGYRLASGADDADILVAFHPSASEQDIRTVLLNLNLEIVSGPSSLGLYGLRGDDVAGLIQALMTHETVVESAQDATD